MTDELELLRDVRDKAKVLLKRLTDWCLTLDEPLATATALRFGPEAERLMDALEAVEQRQYGQEARTDDR